MLPVITLHNVIVFLLLLITTITAFPAFVDSNRLLLSPQEHRSNASPIERKAFFRERRSQPIEEDYVDEYSIDPFDTVDANNALSQAQKQEPPQPEPQLQRRMEERSAPFEDSANSNYKFSFDLEDFMRL